VQDKAFHCFITRIRRRVLSLIFYYYSARNANT
jgi:hypothetical protein